MANYELFRDSTKLADGTVDGKYIRFANLSQDIPKGQTYQYQVKADVEGGSVRTVDLGLYRNTDLMVKGQTYGFNVTPTYTGTGYGGAATAKPVLSDNTFTISNGTLTVERGNSVGSSQYLYW